MDSFNHGERTSRVAQMPREGLTDGPSGACIVGTGTSLTSPVESELQRMMVDLHNIGRGISARVQMIHAQSGDLERHELLADTQASRRMEVRGSRDNRVMWFGYPVENKRMLDEICAVAHHGAHFAGEIYLLWQVEAALALKRRDPTACLDPLNLLREILTNQEKSKYLRELGAYVQWQNLADIYWSNHREFEGSHFGSDPAARWRFAPPTSKQLYIVSRIVPIQRAVDADFVEPSLANRGDAHDFIKWAGGNPTFTNPPALPGSLW